MAVCLVMRAKEKYTKEPSESLVYDFDFSNQLRQSDTITGVISNTAAPDEDITVELLSYTDTLVQLRISEGLDGVTYKVTVLVGTLLGDIQEITAVLKIKEY